MGGSIRANSKGKPGVAQLSGVGGGGGLPIEGDAPSVDDVLIVDLVNVDADVASIVRPGASVSVRGGSAFVASRRLGDFSAGDAEAVRRGGFTRGAVYSVSADGSWATVQLTK